HLLQFDARLPVAHRFAHRGLEQAEELLAARREHEARRLAAEIRPHQPLPETGLQQDAQRLLDIGLAVDIAEPARWIGFDRERPAGTEKCRCHGYFVFETVESCAGSISGNGGAEGDPGAVQICVWALNS